MKTRKRRQGPDGTLTKVMLREQIAFATRTADALKGLGAEQVEPAYENGPDSLVVSMGRFALKTKAGRLLVSAYGDAIMTRFDDAEAGARLVGATVPSGKWNFHKFHVGLEHDQEDADGLLLDLFLRSLRPVLLE